MRKIKSYLKFLIFILLLMTFTTSHADYILNKTNLRPQLGIWFGPVTPIPGTTLGDNLDTYLGGGLLFRMNLPSDTLKTEIGISYGYFTSQTTLALHYIPIYSLMSYKLPFDLPIDLRANLGLGSMWLENHPEEKHNWEPFLLTGGELSFPAGKWVRIGVKFNYLFVYEDYIKDDEFQGARTNGHFLEFGLLLNFFLTR